MATVKFLVAAPAAGASPLMVASYMAAGASTAPAHASSNAGAKPDGGCPPSDQSPSLGRAGRATFKDIASLREGSSAPNTSIVEAPTVSIQLPKEVLECSSQLNKFAMVCSFNDFWPNLVALRSWIDSEWFPLLEGEITVCPLAKGFFTAIFDSSDDRDLVSSFGPWFWGREGLSMQLWTPDFDPTTTSISTATVWVRLPSLPLHFRGGKTLEAIGNGIGKYLCNCPEAAPVNSTFARICVEMEFNKGFLAEIILLGENVFWTQKIDFENLCFRCRVCFETGHITWNCEKSSRKRRPSRRQRPTWWTGAQPEKQAEAKIPPSKAEGESVSVLKELVKGEDPAEAALPKVSSPTKKVSSWADIAEAEEVQAQPEIHNQGQSNEWQVVTKRKKHVYQRENVMTRSRSGSLK
jgi:hypothetical protein